jgi:SPP1 gp7 family putative phage head morphogenesis protein
MSEIELRDAILRHALQLQRLAAGQTADVEKILNQLERELRQLLNSNVLSEASKREIAALIDDAEKAIHPAYAQIASTVDTHALALIVAEKTVQALEDAIPASIATPTAERLASLTKDVLIDGAPSSAWWEKQAEDTAFKFAAAVRQGVVNGETNERIVARIVGSRNDPTGILPVARRNARALVHSSVMSAANDARLATFRKNARLISGVRWLSTLDSHTCVQCAALDGAAWDLDGQKLTGTKVDFLAPPAHWSCRCVLSPIPKTFADLGFDIAEPETGTRASANGPVSATTSFADFLKRQPPSFVDKVLGARRAELFLDGKLSLSDLISGTGRELTLAELPHA